ncbi:MAG: pitrilysin family protein [Candidatus Nanoarchaeia archaeon]|nr:pitrilysin family protein [Candidatus Nanoarchaeia archaeon]
MERVNVNGISVILDKVQGNSVVVLARIKVGSIYENEKIAGISHFTEHMVFEGTKKRSSTEISNAIEKLGGEINAFTDYGKTVFYVKIAKKHIENALDILSDIVKNPVFEKKSFEKEKRVVVDEVNMVFDDPKMYQWWFMLRNLFDKNPVRNPIYGKKEVILNMSRNTLLDFYNKYYTKQNLEIIVVGNFNKNNTVHLIKRYFKDVKSGKESKRDNILEKPLKKQRMNSEKRKINQSYMMVGFRTVPRKDKDSYVFDVINAILCRGQSSKLFEEIRTKRGLAYVLGSYLEAGTDYGFLGIYVASNLKNLDKIKEIIFNEIEKLKNISDEDLKKAKDYQEGTYLLEMEEKEKRGTIIASWSLSDSLEELRKYISYIKKVNSKDIRRVLSKYMNKENSAIITIKQA